jgi:DNA-binding NtrC family response regulator
MNISENSGRKGRILFVDDEAVVRDPLTNWFRREGFDVVPVGTAREAIELARGGNLDLAFLDIRMPGMDGMDLLERLHQIDPQLVLIMMTGYASVDSAIRALKNGAFDYVMKPVSLHELSRLTMRALEYRRAQQQSGRQRDINTQPILIGKSAQIHRIHELIQLASTNNSPVLIVGESGTGKEIVARAIHAASPRGYRPLVTIRCGALDDTSLERELFGVSPVGPEARQKGKLETAENGTVFLDDISNISLKTQSDLLNVLQEKAIVRAGAQPIPLDFRCIGATNKNLQQLVKAGTFRGDLFYRLNVVAIEIPPLRERRGDIPALVNHFVEHFSTSMSRPVPRVSLTAMDLLLNYDWPGNVRELENAVERAIVTAQRSELHPADFPCQLHPPMPGSGRSLNDVERVHIERVLDETLWNLSRTARILGIDRTTLYNKLKRYGLKRHESVVD